MHYRFLPVACLLIAVGGFACSSRRTPEVSSEAYREAVTAFYVAVSAMQTTQEALAKEKFDRVVALVPQEPAGWADLGLLLLRQQELDQGAQHLTRAASLAPDSPQIQQLLAIAEGRRGNLAEAVRYWKRALELDPNDPESAYNLALETERQSGAPNDEEAQRVLGQLVARRENLAARVEYARIAAKRGDAATLTAALAPLTAASGSWSAEAQAQLKTLIGTAAANPRAAATQIAFLKNMLLREPAYRAALAEVTTPRAEVGRPLMRFLRLKNPEPQPAAPDDALTFALQATANAHVGASWVGAVSLTGEGNPVIATARPSGVHVAAVPTDATCRGWTGNETPGPDGVAVADLNYDFRVDLAVASSNGVCLLRQDADGRFADVTSASKLPSALLRTAAWGVWPADVDTDGDLDLVLAPREGRPVLLRNNGDGTFTVRDLFPSVNRARGFAWGDFDGEGVPDAAFLDDTGAIRVYLNMRGGILREETVPQAPGGAVAAVAAELNGDAVVDLAVAARDGGITRLSRGEDGKWTSALLTRADPPARFEVGMARLLTADLDNNGATDLIVAGADSARVLLGAPGGSYVRAKAALQLQAQSVADLNGDGRLEVIGITPSGDLATATSQGSRAYRWQVIRPRAATATGDQRINSFGIGGEIDLRSGLHAQKQVITAPLVHFGLGQAAGAELVRITWPNGVLQAEFDTKADQVVAATQRLKGSCPWLFAWNGREMAFVTDVLWRSPLGLRINAQATADVQTTEDWVKVAGAQLAPRDGFYDLRITAELWEAHFFDLASLLVVDHPKDTEVFVDERFAVPAPKLELITTGPVQPFASVRDDTGGDVSAIAASRDSRYLDFAGRGPYQGITRPHFVEVELPEHAPRTGPLWLVAQGWIHPTDSSINVAIGQGRHELPQGLSLQVADAGGRFREVRKGLGFPAGKDKTILINMADLFGPTGPRRLRVATNLEIFWDRLGWAVGRPDVTLQTTRLELAGAELDYRGYSVTEQPDASVPERPRYQLAGTGARWRDLEGYYTRFGDVLPLLRRVDDRYVIMNAGDELRLRFAQAPAPAGELVRDFILITDGWEKDGDYNTSFSRTVLPLPTHRSGRYDTPPRRLEDDPIYREHARDFTEYHTRYVTSDPVRDGLRLAPDAAAPRPRRP